MNQPSRFQIHQSVRNYCGKQQHADLFVPGETRIPYGGRVYDADEVVAAIDACLDFWLTAGPFTNQFEGAFSAYFGLSHAIIVNSGSSANLLALAALTSPKLGDRRLCPGDEVITAAAAFPSTVAPILQHRLVPVFIDVEMGTYNVTPERVAQAIGPRTRAILLAHTMGNPFDAAAIAELARERGMWLIEDNCDALGSRLGGRLTGSFGHLATVSFYPAHHITMGEGGCVLTDDDELARIVRSFRDWGRDCYCEGGQSDTCGRRFTQQFGDLPPGYDHKYVYSHLGYNMRATDIQAAIGCAQLKKLPKFIEARKRNWNALREGLAPSAGRLLMPEPAPDSDPAWFGFVMTVREDAGIARTDLTRRIEQAKIETRNLFGGNVLRHPAFKGIECRVAGTLDNADRITERTFFVGCYPGLDAQRIRYMVSVINDCVRQGP